MTEPINFKQLYILKLVSRTKIDQIYCFKYSKATTNKKNTVLENGNQVYEQHNSEEEI